MKQIFLILAIALLFGCNSKKETIATEETNTEVIQEIAEEEIIEPEVLKSGVLIELSTDLGNMTLKLYDETPLHRDNFLKLVNEGFYDSLLFHRVISKFMVQGGDPNSKNAESTSTLGTGGVGYTVPAEFNPNLIHKKGALAAARRGGPGNPLKASSGCQFYIVQGKPVSETQLTSIASKKPDFEYSPEQIALYDSLGGTPFLDMEYTVFGEVIEGLDIIDKIAAVQTRQGDRPVYDVRMYMKEIE